MSPGIAAYDPDADVRAREDVAKRLWGPDVRIETVAGAFVSVAADRKVVLEQAVSLVRRTAQHAFRLAPKWLDEGLALVFEAQVFPSPGELRGGYDWRTPPLATARERSGE